MHTTPLSFRGPLSARSVLDEAEFLRLKQRQTERERIKEQQAKLRWQTDDDGGLRWKMN